MKHSESIASLAAALAAAQADLKAVAKDRTNPHFKNRYATLDAIVDTVRPALAKHGLSVLQNASEPLTDDAGALRGFAVETMLVHKSGEWISNAVAMPVAQVTPQGAGSALTYGRRYGISALLSLATDEDDDGAAGSQPPAKKPAASKPEPVRDESGENALRLLLADQKLTPEQRATWEKWLATPRKSEDIKKAIVRVEDQITAATAA